MSSNKKIWRLSSLVSGALAAGALLIGSPARPAFAAQPATADEARTMASQCSDLAAQYRQSAAAGALYKTGLVQREEACAARYGALAAKLAAPPVLLVQSPEGEHYTALAAHYRLMGGGAAYKTGLVQSAEAQARRHEAVPLSTLLAPTPAEASPVCMATKPSLQLLCSGS